MKPKLTLIVLPHESRRGRQRHIAVVYFYVIPVPGRYTMGAARMLLLASRGGRPWR